ncbi:MAG: MYXO-CTERM sorting domain-containing protein, partial [Myxococcota bacterium]|nr:MYXO-CTERM sorting domain-containing protein [Myxococcota bacterium]
IDCDGLDRTCRDYHDLTTDRCSSLACKLPNRTSSCTSFVDAAFGLTCGPSSCSGNILYRTDTCGTGATSGTCNDGGSVDCTPYRCVGSSGSASCTTSCTGDAECATGHYCSGTRCYPKKAIGRPCGRSGECTLGNCVDGVCCNTTCAGVCQSCAISGSIGTCAPVPAGRDPEVECGGAGTCGGTCNGMGACQAARAGEPCGTCRICNTSGSCLPQPDGSSCDYLYYCTVGATCTGGVCGGGSPRSCDDGNACTSDSCNEAADLCLNDAVTDGTACPDGDLCNGNETCEAGVCMPATGVTCDDDNPCTENRCNPGTGACSYPALSDGTSCSDGNVCNGAETCGSGICVPGTALDCDDRNSCTGDSCDPVAGCRNAVLPDRTACETDDNACTLDECTAGVCTHAAVPDTTACDEITSCVGSCLSGVCQGGVNCDDDDPCTIESCNPGVGCVAPSPAPDGTPCPDDDVCNGEETCVSLICVPGTALDCDDENPCTIDNCDAVDGCVHGPEADETPCSTATICGGTCSAGVCTGGIPVDCDDDNPCTTDSCDPTTYECRNIARADGATCDDEDACTTGESCSSGVCTGGTTVTCDDDNDCTTDTCDTSTGCVNTITAGATCDDGDENTTDDVCGNDGVCAGTPKPPSEGCGCRAAGSSPPAWAGLAGLAVLLGVLVGRWRLRRRV